MRKCSTIIVFLLLPLLATPYYVKIGILSDYLDPETTKKVWSMAQNYSTMMSLEPIVQMTPWRDIDNAATFSRSICSLVKRGIDALVYLGDPRWNSFISSYSTHLGLPFITALENDEHFGKHQVCMLPDTSEAAADLLIQYGWDRFVFFYDSHHGPEQLQKILLALAAKDIVPRIDGFWKVDSVVQASYSLNYLNHQMRGRFLLATSEEFADDFVRSNERCNVVLLTPVGTVLKIPNQGMNTLIKFSVVDAQDPVLMSLENRLKTLSSFIARGKSGKDIPDSAILHYDSSSTLDTMFNNIARENPSALKSRGNTDCLESSQGIPGTADFLKKVSVQHGATGKINFNENGKRFDYKLNIMQSTQFDDVQKIGTWTDRYGLQMLRETGGTPSVPNYAAYTNEKPVKVTSILIEPFLRKNENGSFSGFAVDFLDELFKEIKMDYHLELVKDGKYGYLLNGQWSGMIGELIRGEAEIAMAPLTKNLQRAEVIHFTKNFMTTGLNILMKKPESEKGSLSFSPFTFLTIWSVETWIVIVVVLIIYSAGGYGISRFIGVPDRVRALETKGTDNLSPCGSVWFAVGSLFCRDTGIYPRNLTHRLWTLFWWIFCIFITLLYVSMLTSALIKTRTTVTSTHSQKSSQEVLKEYIETGFPVLGAVAGGSTASLFMNSNVGLYQRYGQLMVKKPGTFVTSYSEGVKRVRESEGKYALIMESASSELIANMEPCDTIVTSDYLISRPYAAALPKNSTLIEIIDHGILSLTETGKLRELYEKWWHNQPASCDDPSLNLLSEVYNTSMTLHEVSGLFYLFIIFSLSSIATGAVEYYAKKRNVIVSR